MFQQEDLYGFFVWGVVNTPNVLQSDVCVLSWNFNVIEVLKDPSVGH